MVKRKDLTDVADKNYKDRKSEYMLCLDCGEKWGGTRGDYWQYSSNHVFSCCCGSENIALVKDVIKLKIIKK